MSHERNHLRGVSLPPHEFGFQSHNLTFPLGEPEIRISGHELGAGNACGVQHRWPFTGMLNRLSGHSLSWSWGLGLGKML